MPSSPPSSPTISARERENVSPIATAPRPTQRTAHASLRGISKASPFALQLGLGRGRSQGPIPLRRAPETTMLRKVLLRSVSDERLDVFDCAPDLEMTHTSRHEGLHDEAGLEEAKGEAALCLLLGATSAS